KVKKINLRAGSWSIKSKTYSEEGDRWTERWAEIGTKSFDYVAPEPDVEGGYERDDKPAYIQPILNKDGYTTTRYKKVTYREDGETYTDEEEYEVVLATPGFFKGELPSFNIE
ncbi:MAG: hypothetical protein K5931_02560, partial [Lachnospiraceae bacterium]|nr:hypothetical protein [Lachnospiraceae bacterium]